MENLLDEDAPQKRAIKTARERCRHWIAELNITRWRFNVGLCLTLLLEMDAASAAAWCLRQKKWLSMPLAPQPPQEALLQEALEQVVLQTPVAQCVSWTDPDVASLGVTALRAATKASRDQRLREWVKDRNARHGAAVAGSAIANHCMTERIVEDADEEPIFDMHFPVGAGAVRSWCFRWRGRCNGRFMSLRTKEPIKLETKREKAVPWKEIFSQTGFENVKNLGIFPAPISGPFSDP